MCPDGRYYIAGLFGEDGLALLDLWHPEKGVQRILDDYGRGTKKLPVYKMPQSRRLGHRRRLRICTRSWAPCGVGG